MLGTVRASQSLQKRELGLGVAAHVAGAETIWQQPSSTATKQGKTSHGVEEVGSSRPRWSFALRKAHMSTSVNTICSPELIV